MFRRRETKTVLSSPAVRFLVAAGPLFCPANQESPSTPKSEKHGAGSRFLSLFLLPAAVFLLLRRGCLSAVRSPAPYVGLSRAGERKASVRGGTAGEPPTGEARSTSGSAPATFISFFRPVFKPSMVPGGEGIVRFPSP